MLITNAQVSGQNIRQGLLARRPAKHGRASTLLWLQVFVVLKAALHWHVYLRNSATLGTNRTCRPCPSKRFSGGPTNTTNAQANGPKNILALYLLSPMKPGWP